MLTLVTSLVDKVCSLTLVDSVGLFHKPVCLGDMSCTAQHDSQILEQLRFVHC